MLQLHVRRVQQVQEIVRFGRAAKKHLAVHAVPGLTE
jgi:hypothetical protein